MTIAMTRQPEIRFGTFDRLVGTAVHANGWWLRRALGVKLQCESADLHDLSTFAAGVDLLRLKKDISIALQTSESLDFPIGLIACRVATMDDQVTDIAYPFLLRESEGRLRLTFSSEGPPLPVRNEICAAFAKRLAPLR